MKKKTNIPPLLLKPLKQTGWILLILLVIWIFFWLAGEGFHH